MYRNKKDVDKHVESLKCKLSPKDFKTRAYSIARLYYEVGDYGSCQKHVEEYLTIQSNNAAAYKLLGQALQKLGDKERALKQYKTSLEIDPTQTSTILDVCKLLADQEIVMETGQAKYWCEKAEAIFPKHPITFRLKERILTKTDPDPEALENLLKSELLARPKDALLHGRLLKHYLHTNQFREAFDHSCNIEFAKNYFNNNLAWYKTLAEILKFNPLNTNDWLYQLLLLTVKERLCVLCLSDIPNELSKNLVECNELLHSYDQAIESISRAGPSPGFGEFHAGLLRHHQGQLAFHLANFLLKKAKKDQINWCDAVMCAAPLMLIAWQAVPIDPKMNWLSHAPEKQQKAAHQWYLEGSYRCSQSGHYLLNNNEDRSQIFLDQVSQLCSGTHWRDKLYEKIFTTQEYLTKIESSHFASNFFTAPAMRFPRKVEVQAYDDDAQRVYPNSLHHFVWILCNYKNFADFKCTLFDMLPSSMNNCGPETLNKLDVLAFLYSAALTTQNQMKNKENYAFKDRPNILPANITDLLCSHPQIKWWDCAYKLSKNELGSEYTDIRSTLSRGIEIIRCIDNHGLDPELLCVLGRIFSDKAKTATVVEEKTNLEARAFLYYSSATTLLENIKRNVFIKIQERRMFEYNKEFDNREINNLLEEAKLYVALTHLNDGEYEKVIELLTNLKSSLALYHLSDTYKKIAIDERKISKNPDKEVKCVTLLNKAKQIAFKALDKIKQTETYQTNHLYNDTQVLIEDIEIILNKLDLDISNAAICESESKYSSDENFSVYGELGYIRSNANIYRNISSTPKQTTRHSSNITNYRTATDTQILENTQVDSIFAERIDKQIKNLQKRDSTIKDFMEQTKEWFNDNRKLGHQIISTINSNIENTTEQFKLLKISVDQVKEQIDECRNECKDVSDLKKQIAELKKEMIKLKKTSSEQAIDEHDLFNLEEEYRNNDNPATFGTQLPFTPQQVMPPFAQRLVPPFSVPTNPYHLYGQNFYNLYNQYAQFSQPPGVPGAQQLFDPARSQINFPGVYPNPDQMYLDVAHLVPPVVPPVQNMTTVSSVPPASKAPAPVSISVSKSSQSVDLKEPPKSLPINVVITSSDPLPTYTTTPAPVLSVTIPPNHIKGTPHNYQITMPPTNDTKIVKPPVYTFPSPSNRSTVTTTTGPVSYDWNQKSIFMTSQAKNTISSFGGIDAQKSLDNSVCVVDGIFSSPHTSLNKSRTTSERSNTSIENYDPCPDFKPIIPLPAEVIVTTGEEDETTLFSARAKLFRFVDKQWKERGIGEMKLLKHKGTGKVRVLMRREQVHKICANHVIVPEMEIKPMKNETKAYFWVANDFAEETLILEKFCIRFKTVDIAQDFYEAFEKARLESSVHSSKAPVMETTKTHSVLTSPSVTNVVSEPQINKTIVGGFTFSSAPTFKTIPEKDDNKSKTSDPPVTAGNVFSGLTFKTTNSPFQSFFTVKSNVDDATIKLQEKNTDHTKLNSSDVVEEFEPTAEFKPVVPLPALIDQKTGEEDEIIQFEHRAKLLRFDAAGKEWKERGLGNIKLLIHKENHNKVRLVMRREQIMKICCNHALTKDMTFQKMPNMDKAVTWCAKDFSEGELVSETFCLRFKTVQACNDFMEAIGAAQSKMEDDAKAAKKEQNAAKLAAPSETKKSHDNADNKSSSSWGDKFKPKTGSWECDNCFIRNEAGQTVCNACNNPKDASVQKPESATKSDNTPKFTFGISKPATEKEKLPVTEKVTKWGDRFKPKEGTWECNQCLVRNESNVEFCSACKNPKNPDIIPKEPKPFSFNTPGPQFTFGIPKNTNTNQNDTTSTIQKFNFGIPSNNSSCHANKTPSQLSIFGASKDPNTNNTPLDFRLNKNVEENKLITPVKPALLPTPTNVTSFGGNESRTFSFTPKPPAKGKSPIKTPKKDGADSDDNEYASEDEGHHIHFSPVIPMPDKIEVVTGEEDEDELFGHRAKLFRFTSGEWKERGIGIVKILKHKNTGKLRVVMRREQVLKICLNHALTTDVIYKSKDEKTWFFLANDFSEGELSLQNFCLRFSNKDLAIQFKEEIDKALHGKANVSVTNLSQNDSEEVEFVSEIQATAEEKQKAKDLMLPENFYTYKNMSPCQGCRGCSDDVDIKSDDNQEQSSKTTILSSKHNTPVKSMLIFQSPTNSLYGTPASSDKTVDTTVFRTPLGTIGSHLKTPSTASNNLVEDKENTLTESLNVQKQSFVNAGQGTKPTKSSILATPKLAIPEKKDAEPKSIFGSNEVKTKFGDNKSALDESNTSFNEIKPIFGEVQSVFGENKSIFSEKQSMFGGAGVSSNKSIFGFNTQSDKNNSTSTNVSSIFTTESLKSSNVFSMLPQKSIFESNTLKNTETKPTIGGHWLGSTNGSSSTFTFGNITQQNQKDSSSIFPNSNTPLKLFSEKSDEKPKLSTDKSVKEASVALLASEVQNVQASTNIESTTESIPFNVDNTLSFATLSTNNPGFETQQKSGFKWEGAGQPLFSTVQAENSETSKNDNSVTDKTDTETPADEDYDPHYEPIVPLPEKIVVTTGEEDEEKLFGERCKLYRYDEKNREWKERGVGEMKLLYHPERKSYRMLLRREQVHKAVLNMLLFMDLELLPMKNSDRAWTWAGCNYAENSGEQETLAVRFKSVDLAASFYDKVQQCVRKLQVAAADAIRKEKEEIEPKFETIAPLRLPKHLEKSARDDETIAATFNQAAFGSRPFEGSSSESNDKQNGEATKQVHFEAQEEERHAQAEEEHDYENNDDSDGYYNEEEEESSMYFMGKAEIQRGDEKTTCQESHVEVSFDQDICIPKITITDSNTGEILADMIIQSDTEFKLTNYGCSWSGQDYTTNVPVANTVKMTFDDCETAMEFYDSCETSKAATYAALE